MYDNEQPIEFQSIIIVVGCLLVFFFAFHNALSRSGHTSFIFSSQFRTLTKVLTYFSEPTTKDFHRIGF